MLAINRAEVWTQVANMLEQNPERYGFLRTRVPSESTHFIDSLSGDRTGELNFTPQERPGCWGCLWGLAGLVLGMEPGTIITSVAQRMYPEWGSEVILYDNLDKICSTARVTNLWRHDAEAAVRVLREYVRVAA